MHKRLPIFLIIFLLTDSALAQSRQIDSLKARLDIHPQADTGRVNRLNALSKATQNSNPTLALRSAQEALTLAGRLAFGPGQGQAYLNLSLHAVTVNDYKRAIAFAQQANGLYSQLHDRLGQIKSLARLAYIDIEQGNYARSIAYGQRALTLAESLRDMGQRAYVNYILAQSYTMLGDYPKAQTYATVGLRLSRAMNDQTEIGRGLNILGNISKDQGQFAASARYFAENVLIFSKLGQPLNSAINEGNLAEVRVEEGRYADALRSGHRVLAYCRQINATSYFPWIESILAEAHVGLGQNDSAIVYGRRSLLAADAGGQRDISRNASEVLARAYAGRGDYGLAYQHQRRYVALKDSLSNEETIRQTTAMQYTYDIDKKQSQIVLLTKNQKIEQERARYERGLLYASAAIGLLLLTLAIVLIRNNRAKQRTNAELQRQKQIIETSLTAEIFQQRQQLLESQLKAQQEELRVTQAQLRLQQEKERISRDLHDHVGAQLSVIAANANGSAGTNGTSIGEYAREAMQSLRDTVWAIDQPAITLADFRSKLQQYLNRQQQQHPACTYTLTMTTPADPELTSAQALNLFRQVQEALHNTFKHAHATAVMVQCELLNDRLQLSVTDNGQGFDPGQGINGTPHYGLRNLQRRATEMGGICQIETASGRGTSVSVTIPLVG
jgi:signal transduction histidine kinase